MIGELVLFPTLPSTRLNGRSSISKLTTLFLPRPTFPQLYAGGEFVGGLDIVKEELESNPDFFAEYVAAPKGQGGMAAPEAQKEPATASA